METHESGGLLFGGAERVVEATSRHYRGAGARVDAGRLLCRIQKYATHFGKALMNWVSGGAL